ncbi:MAG: hypothetical protein ACREFZ_01905 [Acetobacteraceae bacterium]
MMPRPFDILIVGGDILTRRTRHYLRMSVAERGGFSEWMERER